MTHHYKVNDKKYQGKRLDIFLSENLIELSRSKINFSNSWIHIRKSNTEPVIRIISEASSMLEAEKICKEIMSKLRIV